MIRASSAWMQEYMEYQTMKDKCFFETFTPQMNAFSCNNGPGVFSPGTAKEVQFSGHCFFAFQLVSLRKACVY